MSRGRGTHSRYRIAESVKFSYEDFYSAKHQGQILFSNEIKIKCGSNFHRILLRFPGRITLLNHNQAESKMMMRLGGEKPECLTFLEQWKEGRAFHGNGSRPLVTKLDIAKDMVRNYRSARNVDNDWLGVPIYNRLFRRLGQVYNLTVEKLETNFSKGSRPWHPSVTDAGDEHNSVLIPRLRLEFVDVRRQSRAVELEEQEQQD